MNDPGWTALGDALDILKEIDDDSIDALICDPPAGIDFMGKDWDCFRRKRNPKDVGRLNTFGRLSSCAPASYLESDRHRFVAWLTPIMVEALRVVKPGGYGLIWALPKTAGWTAWALEDAGWEVRDKLYFAFATGFPKNQDASKAIDKKLGKEREVLGQYIAPDGKPRGVDLGIQKGNFSGGVSNYQSEKLVTGPGSPEAAQWEGFGTALKPAIEEWILVRKPFKGTLAENLMTHGTGVLNISACEIGRAEDDIPGWHKTGAQGSGGFQGSDTFKIHDMSPEEIQARRAGKGRHPSHFILEHHEDCEIIGYEKIKGCPETVIQGGKDGGGFDPGSGDGTRRDVFQGYGDSDGMETVERYRCVEGCPVAELARQSGKSKSTKGKPRKGKQGEGWGMTATGAEYEDSGSAARFYFTPKPSRKEKEQGLFGVVPCAKCGKIGTKTHVDAESGKEVPCLLNNHPTIKSVQLMRYFCKLVTPPGGIILDPFMGSGSTGVAAILEGFRFIGIEKEERSHLIACARLKWAMENK